MHHSASISEGSGAWEDHYLSNQNDPARLVPVSHEPDCTSKRKS
jgi:hypothetical protein